MKIYILAQGQGSRWKADLGRNPKIKLPCEYKQLLPIGNGEVLIQRTIRQIQKAWNWRMPIDLTLIAPGDFLLYPYPSWMKFMSFKEPTGCILEGICRTKNEWKDNRVLFLLGDVIYSNRMMREVISNRDTVSFYGREYANPFTDKRAGEIFSFGCSNDLMIQNHQWRMMREIWFHKKINAKLWHFYHPDELRTLDNDYTDDVDSPEEYVQFYEKLKELVLADDERRK